MLGVHTGGSRVAGLSLAFPGGEDGVTRLNKRS